MPALPPVAKVVRVDLLQTYGANARVQDRQFFSYSGALSVVDLTTILNTIANAWGTNMSPQLQSSHSLVGVRGTDLTSNTAAQTSITTSKPGTAAVSATPNGVAIVIQLHTARRYRGGHPRIYLSGVSGANLTTTRTWSAAYVAALQTAYGNFVNAEVLAPPAAVGVLTQVNVSYFAGFTNKTFPSGRTRPVPTPRVTPVQDTIISATVSAIVASQRRRNQQSI